MVVVHAFGNGGSVNKLNWIGLSIHFEKWILILIVNHIFLMDLDWIEQQPECLPKKVSFVTPHHSQQTIFAANSSLVTINEICVLMWTSNFKMK